MAQVLKNYALIVWDEYSMSNKSSLDATSNTLKDIRNRNQMFTGVTVLLEGDFRQTLPVISRGTLCCHVIVVKLFYHILTGQYSDHLF